MTDIQPLSEAEEAELRKIVEKMTPEPWECGEIRITAHDYLGALFAIPRHSIDTKGIVALRNAAPRMLATIAELRLSWVPQDVANDCREMLHGAGFGKPGSPNTLWAMVKAACATIANLRTVAEVADRVTSAPTELARQNSIDELRAALAKVRGGK